MWIAVDHLDDITEMVKRVFRALADEIVARRVLSVHLQLALGVLQRVTLVAQEVLDQFADLDVLRSIPPLSGGRPCRVELLERVLPEAERRGGYVEHGDNLAYAVVGLRTT